MTLVHRTSTVCYSAPRRHQYSVLTVHCPPAYRRIFLQAAPSPGRIGGVIIAPHHDTICHEPRRIPPGIRLAARSIAGACAVPLVAGVAVDVDQPQVLGLGLLGGLLAVLLMRGIRVPGVRRAAVLWSLVALTVEAQIAVVGMSMAATIGFAIVLLLPAVPAAWRKLHARRAPAMSDPPHDRSAVWSDRGLPRPCLGE